MPNTRTRSVQSHARDELLSCGRRWAGAVCDAHGELVAAESGQNGVNGQHVPPGICAADQMLIAGQMTFGVVDPICQARAQDYPQPFSRGSMKLRPDREQQLRRTSKKAPRRRYEMSYAAGCGHKFLMLQRYSALNGGQTHFPAGDEPEQRSGQPPDQRHYRRPAQHEIAE
jgi:hypothetical protein